LAFRAKTYSALAGSLFRSKQTSVALEIWLRAALDDQDTLSQTTVFSARVAALSCSKYESDSLTSITVRCPDPEIKALLIVSELNACKDARKLRRLEQQV